MKGTVKDRSVGEGGQWDSWVGTVQWPDRGNLDPCTKDYRGVGVG